MTTAVTTVMAFTVWDYVVFITTLLISASIGVYARFSGGKQKTAQVSRSCVSIKKLRNSVQREMKIEKSKNKYLLTL